MAPSDSINWQGLQETDEIRLLILQPGSESDPIKCTFQHTKLSDSPKYEALSYMWGPEGVSRAVDIDGEVHYVRENLWQALYHLRQAETARVLWADAICINQQDQRERAHQVSQMGSIYSNASQVCIWLGSSDPSSEKAFEFLGQESVIKDLRVGNMAFPASWYEVVRVLYNPYWARLWIIQEVVLARQVIIHCGTRSLPWETMNTVLQAFKTQRMFARHEETGEMRFSTELPFKNSICHSKAMMIFQHRDTAYKITPVGYHKSILGLVMEFQDNACVDVRDKIYGLHSLAPSCCRKAVPVDYECSAYDICRRLLEHDLIAHPEKSEKDNTIATSQRLHQLIIEGAIRQKDSPESPNSFRLGAPGQAETEAPQDVRIQTLEITGFIDCTVNFVTPPLRDLGSAREADFEMRIPQGDRGCFLQPPSQSLFQILDDRLEQWITQRLDHLPLTSRSYSGSQQHGSKRNHHKGYDLFDDDWTEMFEQVSKALQKRPQIQDLVLFLALDHEDTEDLDHEDEEEVDTKYRLEEPLKIVTIGLSPVGIRFGDQICSFLNSDVTGVVCKDKSSPSGMEIISRCIVAHTQVLRTKFGELRTQVQAQGKWPTGWGIKVRPAPIAHFNTSQLQIFTAEAVYATSMTNE